MLSTALGSVYGSGKDRLYQSALRTVLSSGSVRLCVLRPRGARLDNPEPPLLVRGEGTLSAEGHDGGAGVGGGVLGVGRVERAQVIAGRVDGAVDRSFIRPRAELLRLGDVIRYPSV